MSIQTELTRIINAKAAIKAAVEGKGVTVPDGTLLDGMAALIGSIEAGGGATEPYIEETYDSDGNLIDVNMHGYTKIRDYIFNGCVGLTQPSFPSGITSIGKYAFRNCASLTQPSLPPDLTSIGDYAFDGCTSLSLTSLPSGITSIGNYAFRDCTNLALTSLPSGITTINSLTFDTTNIALTSLPPGITYISTRGFADCHNLSITSIPAGVTNIESYSFIGCTGLVTITFEGTPVTIGNNAFKNCTNLTAINVPWAEGEVANAPWGATNATINYNYTGG